MPLGIISSPKMIEKVTCWIVAITLVAWIVLATIDAVEKWS